MTKVRKKYYMNENIHGIVRGRAFEYSGIIGDCLAFTNGFSNFYIPKDAKEVRVDAKNIYIIHEVTPEHIVLEFKK